MTVSVSILSYALHNSAMPNAVNISVGGQYVSMSSPDIQYDGAGQISTAAGTQTFTVRAPSGSTTQIPIEVVWHFNGTYREQAIDSVECGDTVTVTRN